MKHIPHLALAVFLSSASLLAQPLRQKIGLNEDWQFQRQVEPGSAIEWQFRDAWKPDYDDSGWSKVFLPHSWDQTAHLPWVALNHWRGMGWYRKRFDVPALASWAAGLSGIRRRFAGREGVGERPSGR